MKIQIEDKEIELKNSIRALMLYENIEGVTFTPEGLNSIITLFYCTVLTSSKDYTLEFDKFLDLLDNNPNWIVEFTEWMVTNDKNQNQLKKE